MHSILDLEADRADTNQYETLEHTLGQSCLGCGLAHDHGTELTMISNKDYLFGTHSEGNQSLGLDGLCSLIDDNLAETEVFETRVACTDTGAANHVGSLQDLALSLGAESLVLPLITVGQFADLNLEALEFVELVSGSKGCHDMKTEMVDGTNCRFAGLGCETNDTQPCGGNLFCQLIDGNIGWRHNKDLAHILTR